MALRMSRPVKIRGLYYYRQRIPADVVAKLGKVFIEESLKTSNEAEARLRYPAVATKWQAYFEQMRRGVQTLNAAQCEALAGKVYDDIVKGGDSDAQRSATLECFCTKSPLANARRG